MGKKIASTVLITALILLSLCVTNFESAKAQQQEPVVINTDGSATGTSNIQRNGSVYTLTGNISGGIQVQKSNIIIDGAGYTIEGSGDGRGIDLYTGRGQNSSPIFDVTVKNMGIINFGHGIDSANSYNNSFVDNYVADCSVGVWLLASSENGFANNTITLNTIQNNIEGIHLDYSGKNVVITENNLINNGINVYVFLSQQPNVDRNYWSDYTTKYQNAKEVGNTGVWDTPYEYSEGTVDNNPLTKPIGISLENNSESDGTEAAIPSTEPFPTMIVIAAFGASVAVIGFGLFLNFSRRGRSRKQ